MADESHNLRGLIARFRQGQADVAGDLVEILHPELRKLAAAHMRRERTEHTWQPTALVNELYLELLKTGALGDRGGTVDDEKKAFFGFAAHLMRRLLIHHARPLSRRVEKVELGDATVADAQNSLTEMEELLARLAGVDPQLRMIVEWKVFEGLTMAEIAGRLGCSERTVAREWNFARHWLKQAMSLTD